MDPKEIKKNKKVYIDMIIDISTHLSYNELTYIEQKVFCNKLLRSATLDIKTLDLWSAVSAFKKLKQIKFDSFIFKNKII